MYRNTNRFGGLALLATLLLQPTETTLADGQFFLDIDGICPGGVMTMSAIGVDPGALVGFAYSTSGLGSFTIPSGICAGTTLGLAAPVKLGGTAIADASGEAVFSAPVPVTTPCDRIYVQAVDTVMCVTSNPVRLDNGGTSDPSLRLDAGECIYVEDLRNCVVDDASIESLAPCRGFRLIVDPGLSGGFEISNLDSDAVCISFGDPVFDAQTIPNAEMFLEVMAAGSQLLASLNFKYVTVGATTIEIAPKISPGGFGSYNVEFFRADGTSETGTISNISKILVDITNNTEFLASDLDWYGVPIKSQQDSTIQIKLGQGYSCSAESLQMNDCVKIWISASGHQDTSIIDKVQVYLTDVDEVKVVDEESVGTFDDSSITPTMTASTFGVIADRTVEFWYSDSLGSALIPSGSCSGTKTGLGGTPQYLGEATADIDGNASYSFIVPQEAQYVQAVVLRECRMSPVVQVPK